LEVSQATVGYINKRKRSEDVNERG